MHTNTSWSPACRKKGQKDRNDQEKKSRKWLIGVCTLGQRKAFMARLKLSRVKTGKEIDKQINT